MDIPFYFILYVGKNTKICILDTGLNGDLAQFLENKVTSYDFTSDQSTEDFLNHGTSAFSVYFHFSRYCIDYW